MFFLLSITPAETKRRGRRGNRRSGNSIITYSLVGLWILLIAFEIVSAANPPWLAKISDPGRSVEARTYKDVADLLLRNGHYDLAISNYLKALEIKPDMVGATVNMAITFGRMGMVDKAIATLEDALAQNPERPSVIYYNLAEICEKSGRTDDAITYYNKSAEKAPFAIYAYRKLGKIYLERGDWDSAIYALQKALDNKLTMKVSYEGMLKRDINSFPDDPEVREAIRSALDKGVSWEDLKPYDNKIFVDVLKSEKELSRLHDYIGYAYAMKGDLLNAIPHFRIALSIWPENEQARNNLNAAIQDERNG